MATPHTTTGLAAAMVTARGAARIRAGHPWVFRQDVVRGPEDDAASGGPSLVVVRDGRGKPLGVATWAARAKLALRMVETGAGADVGVGVGADDIMPLVARRLDEALARRRSLRLDRDAFRVCHAESDSLPGLFVDCYADAAVIQTTSVAMNAARAAIAALVAEKLSARIVIARDDGSMRDFEGLPRFAGVVAGAGDTRVVYRLGQNQLETDLLRDGKTGGFLDQADNHAAVAALAPPGARALDAFTYHGGFALALARRGGPVLAADEDPAAAARAQANARRNGLANLEARAANAFDLLRALESQGARFDVVVLDPPALAKRGSARTELGLGPSGVHRGRVREPFQGSHQIARTELGLGPSGVHRGTAADRGYKELVLRGARLTEPGGLLVACSCSGRVTRAHWDELCAQAVADSGRRAQVVARRGAGNDHPELVGVPETGHLKSWILRVL